MQVKTIYMVGDNDINFSIYFSESMQLFKDIKSDGKKKKLVKMNYFRSMMIYIFLNILFVRVNFKYYAPRF